MKKPLNVGIPYTNEEERKLAIAQAERLGYKEWSGNHLTKLDNCIWVNFDGDWLDVELRGDHETIPLERPEKPFSSWYGEEKLGFSYDMDKLTPSYLEDGSILLKPKKKKVKVFIRIWMTKNGEWHLTTGQKERNIEVGTYRTGHGKLLEVIEREYEI